MDPHVNAMQVVMARLDDMEEAMGGLSMRCRQHDNVLTVVGDQQRTIAELRQQQQQTEAAHQQQQHALQLDVERLEGWRKLLLDTIKEQEQKIISKEQEVQALKDELATVHRLLNEG